MAYSPPSYNAVNFTMVGGYTPPGYSAVYFDMTTATLEAWRNYSWFIMAPG